MLLEGGTERGCFFIQIHFRLNHDVCDGCWSLTQRNLLFIKMSGLSPCVSSHCLGWLPLPLPFAFSHPFSSFFSLLRCFASVLRFFRWFFQFWHCSLSLS